MGSFLWWLQPSGYERDPTRQAYEAKLCSRLGYQCQRTQFLLDEGVKAQVVKRGCVLWHWGEGECTKFPLVVLTTRGNAEGVWRKTGMWCLGGGHAHQIPGFSPAGFVKAQVGGGTGGNVVRTTVERVPKDAIPVGGGDKSPGREKGVASFGTEARGSAPNSPSWSWRTGETPRGSGGKRECGVWAGDTRTKFLNLAAGFIKTQVGGAREGMWCPIGRE